MRIRGFQEYFHTLNEMTTANTNINANGFGPQQITDLVMTNLLMTRFGDCFKEQTSLSLSYILKLLLLMSAGELKTFVVQILSGFLNYMKTVPSLTWPYCGVILRFLHLKYAKQFRTKQICPPLIVNPIPVYTQTVSIDIEVGFLVSLYKFLQEKKDCEWKSHLIRVEIKNSKEKIFVMQVSNIVLHIDDVTLKLNDSIEYQVNSETREIKDGRLEGCGNIKTFSDLLTPAQKEVIDKCMTNLRSIYSWKSDDELAQMYLNVTDNEFSLKSIVEIFQTKHTSMNTSQSILELCVLEAIAGANNLNLLYTVARCLTQSHKFILDLSTGYDYEKFCHPMGVAKCNPFYVCVFNFLNQQFRSTLLSIFESFDSTNITSTSPINTKNTSKISHSLTLMLTSKSQFDLSVTLNAFFKRIYDHTKQISDKIKVFYLSLTYESIKSEIPNPAYTSWTEKKELLTSMKPEGNPGAMKALALTDIPSKTIVEETMKPKVSHKQMNEISKEFDTLYLRRHDKEKLMNAVTQFRDKKDILSSLGLQNKLNILLYGCAGTGKTSTIQAIATYLKRDIYYVDLKHAKTNEDLQMIFEYVNKTVPSSGLIILEDIDCMTEVVKRRKKSQELSTTDVMNSSQCKVTLDYFLNILQGTLTIYDSIFIVTTNHYEELDPAFTRDGRFEVKIEFKLCDHYQMDALYQRILGRPIPNGLLSQISEDKHSPASLIYHIKNYIFQSEKSDEEILAPFISS